MATKRAPSTGPSTSTSTPVLRTATLQVRERSAFGGRTWKSKGVELDETALTIHQPSSSRQLRLPLGSITEIERTDLMPHSLSVKCAGKVHHFAFDSDGDLYDWQDDIYNNSPLGKQTTNPFDFKHNAHIGAGGASGTFADSNTLPLFEEMMGRSKPTAATTGATALSPAASRRGSVQAGSRRRSNPLQGNIVLTINNNVNLDGAFFVRQTGMFSGWYWKERWLSLKGDVLVVHTRKTKASPPAKEIPLSTVTSVEPDIKRPNALLVTTTRRDTCITVLFATDNDLYAWRDAIYLRSGASASIGAPTHFVHSTHVTYDVKTGELKGLPDQWKSTSHSAHIVQLPIQPSNNASASRSSRRRSQPEAKGSSTAPFSNLTRLAPPSSSADTQSSSPLKGDFASRSPDNQFLGTSAGSDNTLFSVSPHPPGMLSAMRGKVDDLGPVRER